MFDRISRAAEQIASGAGMSRRGFLGQLGQVALGAAAAVGGVLAIPRDAAAGGSRRRCCICYGGVSCVTSCKSCPAACWCHYCNSC